MKEANLNSKILGSGFVLATVAFWIAASFLAQYLVRPVEGQGASLQPVILVFICTSLFSIYIPAIALKRRLYRHHNSTTHEAPALQSEASGWASLLSNSTKVLPVGILWFSAQYTFTLSLAHTSVTSNTILSSSSSMFTLLASALVLQERVTYAKLLSVAAVMAGTALVTLADGSSDASGHSLLGDALCVLSAVLYSCYTVSMQKQLKEDDPDTPALFFGHIGAVTLTLGLPVIAAAQLLGVLRVQDLQPQALALAGINGLMDYVLADYTWARAVLLLSPTVATLGMSIQIPIATVADLLLGHPHWLDSTRAIALTAVGTAAILAGVFGINLAGGNSSNSSTGQAGSMPQAAGGMLEERAVREPLLQQQIGDGSNLPAEL